MSLKIAFSVPPGTLNKGGSIKCVWNSGGTLLAVCGNTGAHLRMRGAAHNGLPVLKRPPPKRTHKHPAGVARIYDRNGSQVAEVQLESRAQCLCLDWDCSGEVRPRPAALSALCRRTRARCPAPPLTHPPHLRAPRRPW